MNSIKHIDGNRKALVCGCRFVWGYAARIGGYWKRTHRCRTVRCRHA